MAQRTRLIEDYNKTITILSENQKAIKKFIDQYVREFNQQISHMLSTVSIQNILSQLFFNINYINEFLDELENAHICIMEFSPQFNPTKR